MLNLFPLITYTHTPDNFPGYANDHYPIARVSDLQFTARHQLKLSLPTRSEMIFSHHPLSLPPMTEENSQDPLPVLPASQLDLQYAPTQRGGRRPITVMVSGLVTSLLAILLSYLLTHKRGDSITDSTVYFLVPLGAFAVGLLAGSGYAIASWITGVRLRTSLEIIMVCLLLLTYVGTQYVEWAQTRSRLYRNRPNRRTLGLLSNLHTHPRLAFLRNNNPSHRRRISPPHL